MGVHAEPEKMSCMRRIQISDHDINVIFESETEKTALVNHDQTWDIMQT